MELKNLFKKASQPSEKNNLRKKMKEETLTVHQLFNGQQFTLSEQLLNAKTEEQITSLLVNNYTECIQLLNTDLKINKKLIRNKLFIHCLVNVTNMVITNITNIDIITLSNICFRYIVFDSIKAADDDIKNNLYLLIKIIHFNKYNKLMTLNLPNEMALDILMYAGTGLNESLAVSNVNKLLIMTNQNKILNSQTIIKIYEIMFTSMRILFLSVSSDYVKQENSIKQDIQNNIIKATLALLEHMDLNSIYLILKEYITLYTTNGKIDLNTLDNNVYKNIAEAYKIALQDVM